MERMTDEKIRELCAKMDSLFMNEGVKTAQAFNVIATWIIGTTLEVVALSPATRPENDILTMLDEIKRRIASQADRARELAGEAGQPCDS